MSNTTNTYDGTIVGFSCEEGYKLDGPASIMCLNGGQWSFLPPICTEGRYTDKNSDPS